MTREESTMKHPKKPELWSNVEISADTDGYLAAQEAARRADEEAEIESRRKVRRALVFYRRQR
jgi:CO/xanthine dehydrogenase Mo-binding subunit